MATPVNTSYVELAATSPRMVTVALPGYTTIDFGQVNGGTRPSDNADVTSAALAAGVTMSGGSITLSSGGHIKGGKTAYGSGTGFWLGYSSAVYRFDIGSTTQYLRWTGTVLELKGNILGGYAVFDGSVSSGSGNGAVIANEASGAPYGVIGYSSNTSGAAAVAGFSSTGGSGATNGVFGQAFGTTNTGYGVLGVAGAFGSTSAATAVQGSAYGSNSTALSGSCSVSTGIALNIGTGKIVTPTAKYSTGSVTPSFTNKPGAATTVRWLEVYYGTTRGWVPWVQDA